MKNLQEKMKSTILSSEENAAAFLRGLFAAEGSVILKDSGVLFHIDFSAKDPEAIQFYKKCLDRLGIIHGKYMIQGQKFPIYGRRNFKRFMELGIHTLHPDKREKFERGFASYKRTNVLNGAEARGLILQQLTSGPKTYDDLAAALGKARTTIQAHHIPILEREGKIRRAGKRGRAWLWALSDSKPVAKTENASTEAAICANS
ncbi:MAG: LAGLIDADG family homing endonuclease [Methanobacteriota archaeon]